MGEEGAPSFKKKKKQARSFKWEGDVPSTSSEVRMKQISHRQNVICYRRLGDLGGPGGFAWDKIGPPPNPRKPKFCGTAGPVPSGRSKLDVDTYCFRQDGFPPTRPPPLHCGL